MSGKEHAFLVWDAAECGSRDISFISKIGKMIKVSFSQVIVMSQDQRSIVPTLSDLATMMPVVTRFGPRALLDVIVDLIARIAKKGSKFTMVLIANRLSVWINLFRRIPPVRLFVISQEDPTTCLDFAFLPEGIRTTLMRWPDLSEIQGSREEVTMQSITINEHSVLEEDETDNVQDNEELASAEPSMLTDSIMRSASPMVKPLSNMTRQQISVNSPKPQKQDGLNVSSKFQPLIEA